MDLLRLREVVTAGAVGPRQSLSSTNAENLTKQGELIHWRQVCPPVRRALAAIAPSGDLLQIGKDANWLTLDEQKASWIGGKYDEKQINLVRDRLDFGLGG